MLVLSRHVSKLANKNEHIYLRTPSGEEVRIYVIGINGDKVRVGVDAAQDTTILRSELLEGNQECEQQP